MSDLFRSYLAHALTEKKSISDREKLNGSIRAANIDLNPHQVDAAIFALRVRFPVVQYLLTKWGSERLSKPGS